MEIMLHKSFSQNKLRKCSINNVDKYHTNFRKHYTVTYVLSLKRNVTNVFFIFTFLKNCNLHQFSGKIRSENVTWLIVLDYSLCSNKIFQKLILPMKRTHEKTPNKLSKKLFSKICHLRLFCIKTAEPYQYLLHFFIKQIKIILVEKIGSKLILYFDSQFLHRQLAL